MRKHRHTLIRVGMASLACVAIIAVGVAALPAFKSYWRSSERPIFKEVENGKPESVACIGTDTIRVPDEVAKYLGLRTAAIRRASRSRPLPPLAGSLAFDPAGFCRVHSRFSGEIISLGTVSARDQSGQKTVTRPVAYGDWVEQGQLLAVVWSKDLGEKKSELVDALSRLRLDRETLDRLRELDAKAAIQEQKLREAERAVETDLVAVSRAERTLRSWRLSEEEIETVKAEASRLLKTDGQRDKRLEEEWARVEVRAPISGTMVDVSISLGAVVDTSVEMFKIADMSQLTVWAHAYEEDLAALQALPKPIRWRIRLKSEPNMTPLEGYVDQIGYIIDPAQHTALITGRVANPDGRLQAGRFITATVELPPSENELEIPATALVEDGWESAVFVQTAPQCYRHCCVSVARRYHDQVFLRNDSPALQVGQKVLIGGAVELQAAWEELRAKLGSDSEASARH